MNPPRQGQSKKTTTQIQMLEWWEIIFWREMLINKMNNKKIKYRTILVLRSKKILCSFRCHNRISQPKTSLLKTIAGSFYQICKWSLSSKTVIAYALGRSHDARASRTPYFIAPGRKNANNALCKNKRPGDEGDKHNKSVDYEIGLWRSRQLEYNRSHRNLLK